MSDNAKYLLRVQQGISQKFIVIIDGEEIPVDANNISDKFVKVFYQGDELGIRSIFSQLHKTHVLHLVGAKPPCVDFVGPKIREGTEFEITVEEFEDRFYCVLYRCKDGEVTSILIKQPCGVKLVECLKNGWKTHNPTILQRKEYFKIR